jgi:hypothetical protein
LTPIILVAVCVFQGCLHYHDTLLMFRLYGLFVTFKSITRAARVAPIAAQASPSFNLSLLSTESSGTSFLDFEMFRIPHPKPAQAR